MVNKVNCSRFIYFVYLIFRAVIKLQYQSSRHIQRVIQAIFMFGQKFCQVQYCWNKSMNHTRLSLFVPSTDRQILEHTLYLAVSLLWWYCYHPSISRPCSTVKFREQAHSAPRLQSLCLRWNVYSTYCHDLVGVDEECFLSSFSNK